MQSALKKAQRELVAQGKQPFYLKKREFSSNFSCSDLVTLDRINHPLPLTIFSPLYVYPGEEKVLDHVEKFLQLKKSGKLNKYLEKRRRKLSAKDRKWLPSSSPSSSARPSE